MKRISATDNCKSLYAAIMTLAVNDYKDEITKGIFIEPDPDRYVFSDESEELPSFLAICELLSISPVAVRRELIKFKKDHLTPKHIRRLKIKRMRRSGEPLTNIAATFNIGKFRVRQILKEKVVRQACLKA